MGGFYYIKIGDLSLVVFTELIVLGPIGAGGGHYVCHCHETGRPFIKWSHSIWWKRGRTERDYEGSCTWLSVSVETENKSKAQTKIVVWYATRSRKQEGWTGVITTDRWNWCRARRARNGVTLAKWSVPCHLNKIYKLTEGLWPTCD